VLYIFNPELIITIVIHYLETKSGCVCYSFTRMLPVSEDHLGVDDSTVAVDHAPDVQHPLLHLPVVKSIVGAMTF